MDLTIGAAVLAVDIAECGRHDHRVVHRRVEFLLGVGIGSGDLDLAEFAVPCLCGCCECSLEVPSGHFCCEVGFRALNRYRRESHLHHHLLTVFGLERCAAIHVVLSFQLKRVERF